MAALNPGMGGGVGQAAMCVLYGQRCCMLTLVLSIGIFTVGLF